MQNIQSKKERISYRVNAYVFHGILISNKQIDTK